MFSKSELCYFENLRLCGTPHLTMSSERIVKLLALADRIHTVVERDELRCSPPCIVFGSKNHLFESRGKCSVVYSVCQGHAADHKAVQLLAVGFVPQAGDFECLQQTLREKDNHTVSEVMHKDTTAYFTVKWTGKSRFDTWGLLDVVDVMEFADAPADPYALPQASEHSHRKRPYRSRTRSHRPQTKEQPVTEKPASTLGYVPPQTEDGYFAEFPPLR